MEQTPGTLYLCATPIGNLEDITLRVLRVLREVHVIWAEDTRHTLQLLTHFDIRKRLLSCHAHNENARAQELTEILRAGYSVAYCSDAGTPGISDPGARLVTHCIKENLPFTLLPGASAVLPATVLCGIPFDSFSFFGFLPREKRQRAAVMASLTRCESLILLYESPLRLPATLRELYAALGDRPAAVLRELTKLHEQCARGTLSSLISQFSDAPRGECVIAIEGLIAPTEKTDDAVVDTALRALLKEGFSTKDAASAAAAVLGLQKNKTYQRILELEKDL